MVPHSPLWAEAGKIIQETLDSQAYTRWIAPIVAQDEPDGSLTLFVKNEFVRQWIEVNYSTLIRDALQQVSNSVVSFTLKNAPGPAANPGDSEPLELGKPHDILPLHAHATPVKPTPSPRGEMRGAELNANFTFENFVTGPSNDFAAAAVRATAENPGNAYNPLLIYGDTGLGKTHLMQAAAHYVREHNPRAIIYYVSCEMMLNDFIEAIRNKTQTDFRHRYRSVDLLLVDDIQFLARSAELQEEFFNTFNALQNERKQIVLTSDQPPNKISGLEDRLVSRFQQGLTTDIQIPDYATRMAILRNKQAGRGDPLPDIFLDYIAKNITSNVRRLEGALTKLVCFRDLLHRPLTMDVVIDQLSGFIAKEQKAALSCADIQKAVCEEFDLKLADLTSKDRSQIFSDPRKLAMYLCRKLTRCSFPEIGKAFEKNHSTVLHACKTSEDRINSDSATHGHVEKILTRLGRTFDDLRLEN